MSKLPEEVLFKLQAGGLINPTEYKISTPIEGIFAVPRIKECEKTSEVGGLEEIITLLHQTTDHLLTLENGEEFKVIMEHMQLLFGEPVLKKYTDCLQDIRKNLELAPDEMPVEEMEGGIVADGYVINNSSKLFGAICMFDEGIQEQLNSLFPDGYIILPSSVHEVIVMPLMEYAFDAFNELVREVNETTVNAQDVLCNHIIMCKNNEYKMIR